MGFTTSMLFYLLIGGGVTAAVLLAEDGRRGGAFRAVTALLFWPLYVPLILQRPAVAQLERPPTRAAAPRDEMAAAIAQVETELDAALTSLDGWAEDVLARECDRVAELRAAWNLQAERVRELDQLLAQPELCETAADDETDSEVSKRLHQSRQNRLENIVRLRQLREQMHDDLLGTLAWVRELVTMIHLAKYSGAPASRAEELVSQIAAAVEGLSEVTTWSGETVGTQA